MHIAFHHVLKRKKLTKPKKYYRGRGFDLEKIMDKLVYIAALFGIVAIIPQLAKIWIDRSVAGVSIITWVGFLFGSLFWMIYGIIHREKPIIVTNGLYVVIQFLIVLGLFLQHVPFSFF